MFAKKYPPRSPGYLFWDTVRQREANLFNRSQEVTGPLTSRISRVGYWNSGAQYFQTEFDSVAYSAYRAGKLIAPVRLAMIMLYNRIDLEEKRIAPARAYYMDLKPGKEELRVFPVTDTVTEAHITLAGLWSYTNSDLVEAARLKRLGPTEHDEHVILEQLVRGESGAHTR
jgi:hypothetical protein